MGKNPNRKMKWKKLQMEPEPSIIDNKPTQKPSPEVHPFLKIISKNMDAIVKTDSVKAQSDRKLVYMYHSDKSVGVSDPMDLNQYAGVPIQYTGQYTTVQYNPVECEQSVHHSTSQYSTEHQQYSPSTEPNTSTTQNNSINPNQVIVQPQHSPSDLILQPQPLTYNAPQTYYYGPPGQAYQYTQQTQFLPQVLPNNCPHIPHHGPPQDHSHSPHVEYVPLYYYYPVPVPTYTPEMPTTPPKECTSSSNENLPKLAKQISTGSSTSCDSCFVQDKVIRRRRKKKKSIEVEYQEFDSGYFNGAESSSELNSDKEQNMTEKNDTELKEIAKDSTDKNHNEENEREITNLLIKQVQNPTIDFQFGEVQEILDELKSAQALESLEEIRTAADADVTAENEKSNIQHLKKRDCPLEIEINKCDENGSKINLQSDENINKESEGFLNELKEVIEDDISESTIIQKDKCENFSNEEVETIANKESKSTNDKSKIINIEYIESSNKEKSEKVRNNKSKITSNKKNKQDKNQKIKNPQSEDLIMGSSSPIKNTVSEPDTTVEIKEEINVEQIERWTKVKKSRKNKYNMNKHYEDKFVEFEADIVIPIEESTKKDELQEDVTLKNDFGEEMKETCSVPLEEMKTLFFQEKSVEIINKIETSRKKSSKKDRKQNRLKNKPEAHKLSTVENEGVSSNNVENLTTLLNELNFPVLFFHPFLNFEDQMSGDNFGQMEHATTEIGQGPKINTNHEETLSKNSEDEPEQHKLTFLDPSFSPQINSDLIHSQQIIFDLGKYPQQISDYSNRTLCSTNVKQQEDLDEDYFLYSCVEEHLVAMNFLTRNDKKGPNKVILIRRKNIPTKKPPTHKGKTPVKRTEVPGPRLKYNPVVRVGPLGVKRKVVPPQCLVTRFARI